MKCSFCKQVMAKGTGTMYVQKTGDTLFFCSSKCEKNMLTLGRKPRTTRWTAEFKRGKGGAA